MQRVTLLLDTWAGACSEIVAGIGDYLRLHRNWIVQRREAGSENWDRVTAFRPDGVIASVNSRPMHDQLLGLKVPVVNIQGLFPTTGFPRVTFAGQSVGRMLVDHLYAQGHRNLAMTADLRYFPIQGIREGADARARELSVPLRLFDLSDLRRHPYAERNARLRNWLATLDLPVGILTGLAEDAEGVAQRCHQLDLAIPEKVSIVTINNDQIAASLAYPEFTTVDIPWRLMGFQAAELLDKGLAAKTKEPLAMPHQFVEPTGIRLRRSSDSIAVADADLGRAVTFIRENADKAITVGEIASVVGMSRRLLERRFADIIGHSPFAEIRHQQLERVKTFLLHSEKSIEEILPNTAFSSASHLSNAFKKSFGLSPGQFRKKFKKG